MNVTFHTIAGIATAAVLSPQPSKVKVSRASVTVIRCAAGFMFGILLHGVLDFLPHEYPLRPTLDVTLALLLVGAAFVLTQKQHWLLLSACFLGEIFPDLLDLGPAVLNKYLGVPLLLSGKIFPWHWRGFSGSIYDGSKKTESMWLHAVLLLLSGCLLYFNRNQFFNFGKVSKMRFVKESVIKAAPERVFAFHELPDAINRLTPPWENAEIIQPPKNLEVGTRVIIAVKIFGLVSKKWIAEHTAYDPPRMFEDTQISGPFKSWRHRHIIKPHSDGAILRDEIEFEPPFWIFGKIATPFAVLPKLKKMFEYRHEVTRKWCEEGN